MTRTPLKMRTLPPYTRGEDTANMVTHIIGGALGISVLVFSVLISAWHKSVWGIVGGSIYGFSMILLYTVSSVYHGLRPGMGKKVMQVIDHCTIYFLIVGTYTPILFSAIRPSYPLLAWVVFGAEWGLAAAAAVFTAIDHQKFAKFSMICYICMGWCIILLIKPVLETIGIRGFMYLFAGGFSYTLGAALYGVGSKKPIFHTVFHVFVDIGSILQACCILFYVL